MAYLIWALVILATCIGLIFVVGKSLPLEHVATEESHFATNPERLFELAVQLQNASDVKARVVAESPPNHRVTEIIEGPDAAFGGTWTFECSATETGTTLVITEQGKVYHPIFRFMSKYLFGHHASMRQFMKNLHKKVEG